MLITHSDLPEDPSLVHSIYVGWPPNVSNSSSGGSSFLFTPLPVFKNNFAEI